MEPTDTLQRSKHLFNYLMKILPTNCDDQAIRNVVIEWNDLLAQEKYQDALDLLHPSYWDPKRKEWWTAEILENHIKYQGSVVPVDERRSKVTPFHEAETRECEPWFEVGRGPWAQDETLYDGCVHYDLPLDGFWSDLTARFQIRIVPDGIALELQDIHVL